MNMGDNQGGSTEVLVGGVRAECAAKTGGDAIETRLCTIEMEFRKGIDIAQGIKSGVTFFGSARKRPGDVEYDQAYTLAHRIAAELKVAVVTGGGPGIMEAANKGAYDAGGESIGFTIKLPNEQETNHFLTKEAPFYYFFTRKVALSFPADAYVIFPGGFGTLDEFAEVLTLVQTGKIKRVPIILIGTAFWTPLIRFFTEEMLHEEETISAQDVGLFTVTDDLDEAFAIIRMATESERTTTATH